MVRIGTAQHLRYDIKSSFMVEANVLMKHNQQTISAIPYLLCHFVSHGSFFAIYRERTTGNSASKQRNAIECVNATLKGLSAAKSQEIIPFLNFFPPENWTKEKGKSRKRSKVPPSHKTGVLVEPRALHLYV